MENMNIYKDDIDMRACCNIMRDPRCSLCIEQRYKTFNYDENIKFTIVPAEEIEE